MAIETIRPTNASNVDSWAAPANAYDTDGDTAASKTNPSAAFEGVASIVFGQVPVTGADAWAEKQYNWQSARLIVSFSKTAGVDDTVLIAASYGGDIPNPFAAWLMAPTSEAVNKQEFSVDIPRASVDDAGFGINYEYISKMRVTVYGSVGADDGATAYVYDVRIEGMTAIDDLRDRPSIEPIYLADIQLGNGGPLLHIGTRQVTVDGILYEPLLESVSGIGEELKRIDSAFRNIDVDAVIKNDRWRFYDHLIEVTDICPLAGAAITLKELYLLDGEPGHSPETLLRGACDQPRDIDLAKFSVKVSSRLLQVDKQWTQQPVDPESWPLAYDEWGKMEPINYGVDLPVPALNVDWGQRTTLDIAITDVQTTGIRLLDKTGVPAAGTVTIDTEEISYTSIDADGVLGGVTRNVNGTTAAAHGNGATVQERPATVDCLLDGGQVQVGEIFAEIDGALRPVAGGVSVVYENGKTLLRAGETIDIRGDLTRYSVYRGQAAIYTEGAVTKTNNFGAAPAGLVAADGRAHFQSFLFVWKFPSSGYVDFLVEGQLAYRLSPGNATNMWLLGNPWVIPGTSWFSDVFDQLEVTDPLDAQFAFQVDSCQYYTKIATEAVDRREITRFHAKVSLADPDGNYGGLGVAFERPDRVIKHFLVERCGYSIDDEIDADSFDAAGSLYDEAIYDGYKFGFSIREKITPSEWLTRMAFECRSALRYIAGKWYLDYLPNTPPEAIKQISSGDLAGERAQFIFSQSDIVDLANDITANFGEDYTGVTGWLGAAHGEDGTSIAKHGRYPISLDFRCIRIQAMADDVVEHVLFERKDIRLMVKCPVFWEHFDLVVGDTFSISGELYNNRLFYIEAFGRRSQAIAEITGRGWWH